MKYEIVIDGQTNQVSIEKHDGGYKVSLNDQPIRFIDTVHLSPDSFSMLVDGRSFDVGYGQVTDGFEVEIFGERHIAEVIDPRKKSLKMAQGAGSNKVITRMPGRITEVNVEVGQEVQKGDTVVVIEAMKMENPLKSPINGFIETIEVQQGEIVQAKQVLLTLRGN